MLCNSNAELMVRFISLHIVVADTELSSCVRAYIASLCSWCTNTTRVEICFTKKVPESYKSSINGSQFTTVLNEENTAECGQISYVLCKNGQTNWRYYWNVCRYSLHSCSNTRHLHEHCAASSLPKIGPLSCSKCVLIWIRADLRGWVNGTLSSTVCAVPSLFMPMAKHFW